MRGRTVTPVVPSPISWSWLRDSSTSSLPIWFSTSICSRIVAPSLAAGGGRLVESSGWGPTWVLHQQAAAATRSSLQQQQRALQQQQHPAAAAPALTDDDVAVGPLQQLVHALWAQRGAQHPRHRLGRRNVALHRRDALDPRLLVLVLRQQRPGGEQEGGGSQAAARRRPRRRQWRRLASDGGGAPGGHCSRARAVRPMPAGGDSGVRGGRERKGTQGE